MTLNKYPRPAIGIFVWLGIVLATVSTASAGRKEKVLYSFQGGNDGAVPAGGMVFDKQGNLYGATSDGGSGCTAGSCGTVFQLVPPANKSGAWSENILHNFQGQDGSIPEGGVILDAAGNVYGTTGYGGSGPCTLFGSSVGCGVVYEMVPPKKKNGVWTEKVLYSFLGDQDGQFPIGDLTFDAAGNLYGATQFGGGFGSCDSPFYQHCGTIFKLSPPKTKGGKWTEKVLYGFKSGKDGANPNGGLIFDSKGAIYGTTYAGGDQICSVAGFVGCGTFYQLVPPVKKGGSWTEQVFHRFAVGFPNNGAGPNGSLVFDTEGRIYGTAVAGGSGRSDGVVFRLARSGGRWTERVLHSLQGQDGQVPRSGLTFDSLGNLYGTASGGASTGGGSVFKLSPPGSGGGKWRFAVLHVFTGAPDGSYPAARLTFDKFGNLYSTTQESGTGQNCGSYGCGTVFEVSP
jgi:uncharacterized repeat protein (TIGR03803 family)